MNVADKDPIVMAQPSTSTNNKSLKGREINIGESIIIPNDIKIEAITISITKNGKKIRKPISNAVFNSEVMKAGSTIFNGTAASVAKGPDFDKSTNKFKVSERDKRRQHCKRCHQQKNLKRKRIRCASLSPI